jgi:hypothetical protein
MHLPLNENVNSSVKNSTAHTVFVSMNTFAVGVHLFINSKMSHWFFKIRIKSKIDIIERHIVRFCSH